VGLTGSSRAGQARRQAILAAAEELFATHGYRGTALHAVATRVGISQAGLLHYFPSKAQLLIDVLELRQREDERAFARSLAEHRGDVFDALLSLLPACLFTRLAPESLSRDHPGHEWFIQRFRSSCLLVAELLAARQADGWMSAEVDAHHIAVQIHAASYGFALQSRLDPGQVDQLAAMTSYFDALRGQVGARSSNDSYREAT
jgi:AcrR family transcriptional regulator